LRLSPKIFMSIQSRRVYKLYSELRLLERQLASAESTKDDKDFTERFFVPGIQRAGGLDAARRALGLR